MVHFVSTFETVGLFFFFFEIFYLICHFETVWFNMLHS